MPIWRGQISGQPDHRTAVTDRGSATAGRPLGRGVAGGQSRLLAARIPYQQTEVFRFGNAIVDDWEGKVNAWPLDEGLIDYVDDSYGGPSDENEFAVLNVVANPVFALSGKEIDASSITPEFLETVLHEADGIEANVATGYHAIEFMLWGQDLNGMALVLVTDPGQITRKVMLAPTTIATGAGLICKLPPICWSAIWTGWQHNGLTVAPHAPK